MLVQVMRASVYRTREGGIKLPRPTPAVYGDVLMNNEKRGDESWLTARITDGSRDLLRPLIQAKVLKVSEHGMVIEGTEVVARSTSQNAKVYRHRQVWWVFVMTHEAVDRYDGEDPLDTIADRQRTDF